MFPLIDQTLDPENKAYRSSFGFLLQGEVLEDFLSSTVYAKSTIHAYLFCRLLYEIQQAYGHREVGRYHSEFLNITICFERLVYMSHQFSPFAHLSSLCAHYPAPAQSWESIEQSLFEV